MNSSDIRYAKGQWDVFILGLSDQEAERLSAYAEPVKTLDLFALYLQKDYEVFDVVLTGLSKQYRFEEKVIPLVLLAFRERNQSDKAFTYLLDAEQYHIEEKTAPLPDFKMWKDSFMEQKLYDSVKLSLIHLRNFDADVIPPIIPDILNRQKELHEFIRVELLNALAMMLKKIVALESIRSENRYNDILMISLRLRFPVWGWEIADQPRTGKSGGKVEAGEADFIVTAAGRDKALIEAFPLATRSRKKTNDHILKCREYVDVIKHYYIVVFFIGKKKNFLSVWKKYAEDVLAISYPNGWKIDKAKGFSEVSSSFECGDSIVVAETRHGTDSILTHIMVNIGEDQKIS